VPLWEREEVQEMLPDETVTSPKISKLDKPIKVSQETCSMSAASFWPYYALRHGAWPIPEGAKIVHANGAIRFAAVEEVLPHIRRPGVTMLLVQNILEAPKSELMNPLFGY